jgi:hypothetical protein
MALGILALFLSANNPLMEPNIVFTQKTMAPPQWLHLSRFDISKVWKDTKNKKQKTPENQG